MLSTQNVGKRTFSKTESFRRPNVSDKQKQNAALALFVSSPSSSVFRRRREKS